MKIKPLFLATALFAGAIYPCIAEDRIELETTFIKGNTEMPQIIYIVPWQDMKQEKHKEQTLVLHSLFGDLFEPVYYETMEDYGSKSYH